MENCAMNVVYYSSDFFSEMCGVAIESLCANNSDADKITVFVVEDCISENNKMRLMNITNRYGRDIHFIRMPSQEEVYPGVEMNLGRTYARMALGEILPPEVDRVLSLDSDTLVMDSLSEMYNVEFSDEEYVAGVYDCVGSAYQDDVLHAPKDMKYCNAGVFLIDLKKWRDLNVGKQLLDAVLKNAEGKQVLYFLEQDIMNLTFYGHLKLLHPSYNVLTSIFLFDYQEIMKMKKPVTYYSEKEILEAKERPVLLHATTCYYIRKRMWVKDSDHPYHKWYQKYRANTDWRNDSEIWDERKLKKKVYASLWHMMPRSVAVRLSSIAINHVRPAYAKITSKMKISTIATQSST